MAINGIDRFAQIDLALFQGRMSNGIIKTPARDYIACVYGPHRIGYWRIQPDNGFVIPLHFVRIASTLQSRHYSDFPHLDETSSRLQAIHNEFALNMRNRAGVRYPFDGRVFDVSL